MGVRKEMLKGKRIIVRLTLTLKVHIYIYGMKLTSKHSNLFIKRYLFKKYKYISLQLSKGKKTRESYIGVS